MNIVKFVTSRKYRFFQKKISDVTASLWELDFKISKARGMREASRQARDRSVESLQRAKAAPVTDESKKAVEKLEAEVKGYEAQMSMIDDQINGTEATLDVEGQKGLIEYMEGLADLRRMYKEYANQI